MTAPVAGPSFPEPYGGPPDGSPDGSLDGPRIERSRSDQRWDRARCGVVLGWIGFLGALVGTGSGWSLSGRSAAGTFLGVRVPDPLTVLAAVLTVAGLLILVRGPQPWRATRWAWFWCLANPVGTAAFLLLSGPVPGFRKPRRVSQRFTGGWGFALLLVASGTFTLWGIRISLT